VRFSILVNGTPIDFLVAHVAWDSPLLFIIVMEALGRMISTTANGVCFLASRLVGLNLSPYTLILCGIDPDHVHHLWCLFLCFKTVSGLKIDLAK
jgi:hypothetical protein